MEKLIEVAFPLKQTSLDAVHEKNVRHGHISTLHIWPARRPLAAARAALLAALLDAPQDADERDALTLKIGGKLKREREGDPASEVTVGGVLRWCGDAERARKEQASVALAEMRGEILRQYGDKAPKVLDLFAGGGAIPLEALRLGCNVTAVDYNPVAWFLIPRIFFIPGNCCCQLVPLNERILSLPVSWVKSSPSDCEKEEKAASDCGRVVCNCQFR